ncbi:Carboxypeptidase regulatory-like domain-containing protein [Luteibacter sp. UNCMF331Sha3.1]|uniref:TonB-dependent receptor n=1 Tax=Luteibacter sp. UNCMF331Sha3.1 TaxID=1502760 RepID=UPI0008BA9F26|nr:carboxypeptidase regulatory-like domain-containing protein [Luteibacter sp. UNCMF331Sha3.1]SEM94053.1 Carboxypeptidase regulatory-like domain-containing protein [Luteibacter sp. UNCMF331Sha3.1]
MNSRIRAKLLPLAIASLLAAPAAFAQETSSTISGRVLDASGQPVSNATVTIVHEPSGTTKTTTTDAAGRYSAQGLRVGGPFDVTATKDGTPSARQDNVYLQLGADTAVNLSAGAAANAADATALGAVTVSAVSGQFTSENKGLGTNISQAELKAAPSPSGNIADIARRDPRVNVDHGTGAISANGQNTRLNNIKVDGLGVGDPFGLNSTGMPTVGSPVSLDTIDSFNISTANYDVGSDTVGAEINAVTKSGTNEFHGSAYYGFKNASSMVGKAGWLDNNRDYTEFDRNWKAGATVGGPIIKDKLFFFAGYEKEEVTGLSSGAVNGLDPTLANSTLNKVSPADLQKIINGANALGLTPGTTAANAGTLVDKRYIAKIDWNITDGHRMNLAYSRTKETKPNPQGNGVNSIGLSSYWYTVNTDIKNYTLQSFDDWSDNFSSEAKVGYSDYQLNRSVDTQQPQITVRVNNTNFGTAATGPTVNLGEDQFSHYNSASVKSLNAMWAGTLYLDDHTIKGGFEWERNRIYNLFGRTEFGAYTFGNNGANNIANGLYSNYSLYQPAPGYSLNDIAAQWELRRHTFFLQDTWQPTENLSVQFGFRVNRYLTDDKPLYNADFARTYGFSNANTINGSKLVEPRFSFNYTFDSEYKTQLRGGVGLFQSDPPTVWMTNPYQNNGINIVTYSYDRGANGLCTLGTQKNIPCPQFSADPFKQPTSGPGVVPQQAVDTVDKNFKLPSVWKSSLAFDRELPWQGIIGTIEWQHIEVQDGILYQNLNLGAPTGIMPDGRFTYAGCIGGSKPLNGPAATNCAAVSNGVNNLNGANTGGANARFRQNGRFAQGVTYLTNTKKGGSDTVTLSFSKPMADGWAWSIAATGGHASEVNPGTSSQATSNYSNSAWYNPNEDVASTSNTNIAKRLNASLTWQHNFFGDYATTVSAFYDGHSGVPYSWIFGNDSNGDSYSKDLAYIPTRGDGTIFRNANGSAAASQALVDQFYGYIQGDDYLRKKQGEVARRNGATSAWVNQIDLSLSQEIPGIFKGNKGEIRLDIYNFLNLVNKDWGQQSYIGFPYTRNLANFGGVDPATGKYIYNLPTDANGNYQPGQKAIYDAPTDNSATKVNPVSRWSAMLTVRYTF